MASDFSKIVLMHMQSSLICFLPCVINPGKANHTTIQCSDVEIMWSLFLIARLYLSGRSMVRSVVKNGHQIDML